jgi:nucleoside-diphosphate-sugar epimerase
VLPYGEKYLHNRVQYVHVDDVARLVANILRREPEARKVTILNVAGSGDPLTIARCIEMSQSKVIRVPGRWACRLMLRYAWKRGLSAIPPEIEPYMTSECVMRTDRLQQFLGHDYQEVIQHSVADAFRQSLTGVVPTGAIEMATSS